MTATVLAQTKRLAFILFFLTLLAIAAYPVIAEESTPSSARKVKVEQKIETRKANVAARIENIKEKMASREAALKLKLETFKDKRKAEIATRVNTNLNKINENQTAQMQKHLEKMSDILNKLEARVNSGSSDIKDPALARTAIISSRASIASAGAAVSTQADKDYTIEATTEANLKRDAQAKREQLHTDLKTVRQLVISAKQSVANAIRVAKGFKTEKEATSSGE